MADKNSTQILHNTLCEAIHNNNIEQLRTCFSQGVNLKVETHFRSARYYEDLQVCPLALACLLGHEQIMVELLKSGADPNQVSGKKRQSAMLMAAYEGVITLSMIRHLLSYGANANFTDARGRTTLHVLTRGESCHPNMTCEDMLSAAKLLLDNGARSDARDRSDNTPLSIACCSGRFGSSRHVDLVKLFIVEGADVSYDTTHGSLLTTATYSCDIDMFDVLLNAGANRHLTPDDLLEPCEENDHAMIARILETCDVDINTAGTLLLGLGINILHYACESRFANSETVHVLLDHGADVRTASVTGNIALHYAAEQYNCSKIRHLLSYNSPMNIRNNDNQTPLATLIHSLSVCLYPYRSPSYRARVLAFKMLVTAGANFSDDVRLHILQLKGQTSEFEISSTKPLKEMCRLVIRGMISVPVNSGLCKLPIPKLLQEYLNFPEFDKLVEESLNIRTEDDDEYDGGGGNI